MRQGVRLLIIQSTKDFLRAKSSLCKFLEGFSPNIHESTEFERQTLEKLTIKGLSPINQP